ncbi:hypothetical protein D3C72_1884090 [compost metagenome]
MKQLAAVMVADDARPEWHHLHVAARAGQRDGVFAEGRLDLDQAQHEGRFQARAARFIPYGFQEFRAQLGVRQLALQARRHLRQPLLIALQVGGRGKFGLRRAFVANRMRQGQADGVGQRLLLLVAGLRQGSAGQAGGQRERASRFTYR